MRCVEVNTPRVNRDDCVVMSLRVVSVVSKRSGNTNKNKTRIICGVIMAVRVVGRSGGRANGMSTEGNMTLDERKRMKGRWHVLVRDHGSDRAELVDEQKVCPRKGA